MINPVTQAFPNSEPLPTPPAALTASEKNGSQDPAESVFSISHPMSDANRSDKPGDHPDDLRETFNEFVGQTFFGSMLASMRKTVGKPAYMHGGRGEEVFQKQLDEIMVQNLTESSADTIGDPMFELFQLQRR